MFERDYILRLLKELEDALASILALRAKGLHKEALRAIDESFESILGFDLRLLRLMDADSIGEMLRDNDHLLVYLKLHLEEIDILHRMKEPQKADHLKNLIAQVSRVCIAKHGAPGPELSEILERLERT